MDLDTQLVIPPQVMTREVDNEIVLLDLKSGLYFGLDGVGKRIWESIDDDKNLREAVATIIAEYDVEQKQAEDDVLAFAEELLSRGLLDQSSN